MTGLDAPRRGLDHLRRGDFVDDNLIAAGVLSLIKRRVGHLQQLLAAASIGGKAHKLDRRKSIRTPLNCRQKKPRPEGRGVVRMKVTGVKVTGVTLKIDAQLLVPGFFQEQRADDQRH